MVRRGASGLVLPGRSWPCWAAGRSA